MFFQPEQATKLATIFLWDCLWGGKPPRKCLEFMECQLFGIMYAISPTATYMLNLPEYHFVKKVFIFRMLPFEFEISGGNKCGFDTSQITEFCFFKEIV